tara:strand:- start:274 stop:660 length:387 start_codon:yes stop_codon:yes gene_type:complete
MKEYKDDLFYMCPGIDNSKYFYTTDDFPKLKLLERKSGLIRNELKNVITEFEFPIENLQEAWKNFWLISGDSWNAKNIKKCPQIYKLLRSIWVKREELFALLKPGSNIHPHKGTGNYVIRCQLPLLNS